MNTPLPNEGRATLVRSYRNLSEREIRARLEGPMSDAERVTAKAELLRRHAGDDGPDTTLATGFAPTSAFGPDTPEAGRDADDADDAGDGTGRRARAWPWLLLLVGASAAALGWAIHARLVRVG